MIFSERQLVTVLADYETHYNTHRRHRSLDQRSPMPRPEVGTDVGARDASADRGPRRAHPRIPTRRLNVITAGIEVLEPHMPCCNHYIADRGEI